MTKEAREEDSGLHDIRGLAASTKARMSARRSTQNPVVSDEDLIASSSAGWKAVALPEPAKMVSLPELAELPSAKEIKAKDKAAQKAKAAEEKAAKVAVVASAASAPVPVAATAPAATATAADSPAASITNIGSRIAAKKQAGGKGKTIALVGVGVAAAAGVAIFFAMNNKTDSAKSNQVAATGGAPREDYKPTAKMLPPPPPPAPAAAVDTAAAGSGAAAPEPVAQIAAPEEPKAAPVKAVEKADKTKPHKVEVRDTSMTDKSKAEEKKAPAKDDKTKGGEKKDPDAGDPSFDQLLKEAGVSDKQAAKKQVLTKKSLDGSDIKTGMGAVAGKAQACYAGTQGQANVKLTVAPTGQVTKVKITGAFAGTPVGACVEAAVKGTSFPPWDGGPQSFGYTYLLSE